MAGMTPFYLYYVPMADFLTLPLRHRQQQNSPLTEETSNSRYDIVVSEKLFDFCQPNNWGGVLCQLRLV